MESIRPFFFERGSLAVQVLFCFVVVVVIVDGYLVGHPSYKHEIVWFLKPKQSKD